MELFSNLVKTIVQPFQIVSVGKTESRDQLSMVRLKVQEFSEVPEMEHRLGHRDLLERSMATLEATAASYRKQEYLKRY